MRPLWLSLGLTALCVNCNPITDAPQTPRVSASIADGARGGNAHFYWLPPLVRPPSPTGVFDGDQSPVVTITEGAAGVAIANFTMSSGSSSEVLRLDPVAEQYVVNWHTDLFNLSDQNTYRIHVGVRGMELGHADVDVVSSGRELKNVDTQQYIGLLDGRTLPIKFRIEQGALPQEATISPTSGIEGARFTITDPLGRMAAARYIAFFSEGQSPSQGRLVLNPLFSADGTTATGTVPAGLSAQMYFISVHIDSQYDVPVFNALNFSVIP